ncbi:TlpA disulfide reductase family protein [Hyphomonas sp.]|uniref:TlpA disulfide reductase family protein n=1 Tax=Hyphomonas sp. TaxID=87 RepID=UPI000C488AA0|nr:redoxin domain-containing protein [Hyphomonas sp.]MAB10963.1 hypothetical protein [Hyphomonas sp.]MAU66025.1 hypothetical protein [Hyphomonas sp.]
MTRVSWAWTGIALVTGIAFGVFIGLRIGPGGNPNLVDLSALPDQLREQHRNAAFLESEARNYTKGQEQLAKKRAELAKRRLKKLPDGLSSVPLGQLYEPDADVHWPRNVSGDVGVALDEAKDGWVILNYWASWCAPCVHELPEMGEAVPLYAEKGITLIAVNVDPMQNDTEDAVGALFARKQVRGLTPYIADRAGVDAFLDASGQSVFEMSLPTNIIFAPGGVPYAVFEGGITTQERVWTAPATLKYLDEISGVN